MTNPGLETNMAWRAVVEKKRTIQANKIDQLSLNKETQQADRLTNVLSSITTAKGIVTAIESRDVTAVDVAKHFIQRAIKEHQRSNCLTEILFHEALERSAELDRYFQQTGKTIGPLHGVPVTLKDQFNVQGVDSTLGYVGRCFKPASEDAVLVKLLKSMGAIIIAKTNLPQSIMWCETENPLWGRTDHPLNKTFTPGGSTGGEAVLLSRQASILGWGTDLGGSIRIPAHMTGIYGLKPSSSRLPYRGVPVSTEGQEHVPSSIGPMARSLDTLHDVMRAVVGAEPWTLDARCVPIPWRTHLYNETLQRPLTIGVLADDGVVEPHPPVTRVLHEAVEACRAAGHDVIDWNAELHRECIEIMDQFYVVDGGQDIRNAVQEGGEPFIPHVERLVNAAKPISVHDYWQLNKRKWQLQQAYVDKWNSLRSPKTGRQADVLLMPPMPHSAVPHGGCRWVGYTKIWNFLDYPALVIPGGKVSQVDVGAAFEKSSRNELDGWNRAVWESHKIDMASLELPVGAQLICRKLEEEKLLAAGEQLDRLLRRVASQPER